MCCFKEFFERQRFTNKLKKAKTNDENCGVSTDVVALQITEKSARGPITCNFVLFIIIPQEEGIVFSALVSIISVSPSVLSVRPSSTLIVHLFYPIAWSA